ncbi:MAG: DUF2794 domain-containing protein [Hyphomicrobiaceae bacterium]|nr:DUF2794 domain-containing protein [Hyphomicrobiaceae bacterium]
MSETEPISLSALRRAHPPGNAQSSPPTASAHAPVFFTRRELNTILNLYGHKVADGEWRDYAIDFGKEKATFCVFRHTSEVPLYRIEKCPRLARKQGAFSVVTATGLILRRGHELARVLEVLNKRVRLACV